MTVKALNPGERLLSLWALDRLGERETVEWAVTALKQIRDGIGVGTVSLFEFLDKHANERADLPPQLKKIWRLLRVVAEESTGQKNVPFLHDARQKINSGTIRIDEMDRLVEYFRPRLKATELSSWAKSEESESDDPMRWVSWGFKTSLHSSYLSSARLTQNQFRKLSLEHLTRILEKGTSELTDALRLAQEVGWVRDNHDLTNSTVHRVFIPESEVSEAEKEAHDEDRDPDSFNNDFAPIVRILSGALDALADRDAASAAKTAEQWRQKQGSSGLFIRLFAFAAWNAKLVSASDVAKFLNGIDDHAFWRWMIFPEVASLRAIRWNDLASNMRDQIAARLIEGPNNEAFRIDEPVLEQTKTFHRDYEIARLVDSGCDVPNEFRDLVNKRRADDLEFPRQIPRVEQGLPGVRVMRVPEGNPDRFSQISSTKLLSTLVNADERREWGRGDDAAAFARTLIGKRRILEALRSAKDEDQHNKDVWELLLSYPHEKSEDSESAREITEQIAQLALALPPSVFGQVADQLCYWLDGVDENIPNFARANQLWQVLLPHAVVKANSQDDDAQRQEIDLTMAALNEPLGHLLSFFLRRCPTMPATVEEGPSLPLDFVQPLKQLSGRAREVLANRMAILMRYFARADRAWLNDVVISSMMLEGQASNRVWEAFAKYGHVPSPEIWSELQRLVFRQLSSAQLSPEAKRHLAEMSVVVWIWSKEEGSKFELDAPSLRSALGLANDDIRGAAAWRFSSIFRSKNNNEDGNGLSATELWPRLGVIFFQELWPLEPTLQSAATANDFARIPAYVGPRYFSDAVRTVLPYLLPFEVWAVLTEFNLDSRTHETEEILRKFPEDTLMLLAACIGSRQHGVHGLKEILDHIVRFHPELRGDYRVRLLRKVAMSD
jgi:hypothetical protein